MYVRGLIFAQEKDQESRFGSTWRASFAIEYIHLVQYVELTPA